MFRDELNGSAPSFKPWTWAVFDPQTGRTMHGHSGGESKELHQPIAKIELSEVELQYCIRLADWWKSIQIKYGQRTGEESGVIVVNIDEGDYANRPRRSGRVHRLIKDASPQAPPNGFFDCTIEVRLLGLQYKAYLPIFLQFRCSMDIRTTMEYTACT